MLYGGFMKEMDDTQNNELVLEIKKKNSIENLT